MKKILGLAMALVLLCTSVGAIGAVAEGKTINIMYGGGMPLTLDPALNSATNGSNTLRLAHAGIMGYQPDENGKPVLSPELAESVAVSDDGLTYTVTFRPNLKWSDGADFVASQMVSSWERAVAPETAADYAYMYDLVARTADGKLDISADDAARTFTVKLVNRTPYFLEVLGYPVFYPVRVDIADAKGVWATKPETYVGMGPFRMTEFAVDKDIAFEKNPYYWNADKVKLDGVKCLISEDSVAILTAYESGEAQFIDDVVPTEFDRLKATYGDELMFAPYLGTWYVLFNVHKDVSPAGKQLTVQEQSKARFAIGQLINREDLTVYITKGGEKSATGFFPTGLSDNLNPDVRSAAGYGSWYAGTATPSTINEKYTEDQVEACKTLMDLGYAYTGTLEAGDLLFSDFPAIDFAFNPTARNKMIIENIQEIWRTFGIPATINTEAWATLQTKLKVGDAEAARMGWIADFNDCVNFIEIFISDSGNNYPRLGKPVGEYTKASDVTKDAGLGAYWGPDGNQTWADAYDALDVQIKAETDPAKRAELCAQAEKILMSTGAVAPIFFYTRPMMIKPNVKNFMSVQTGDTIWTYVDVE